MKMPATLRISAAIIAVGMALAAQDAWSADSGGQVQNANAPEQNTTEQNTTEQTSPWLAMPTVSSDPKPGTSPGVFAKTPLGLTHTKKWRNTK